MSTVGLYPLLASEYKDVHCEISVCLVFLRIKSGKETKQKKNNLCVSICLDSMNYSL